MTAAAPLPKQTLSDKDETVGTVDDAATDLARLTTPRPISEYHEEMGDVLWWRFPIEEPPYLGSPSHCGFTVETVFRQNFEKDVVHRHQVGGWPGYHTHFSPIPEVCEP